jgi:hypothetical protein
MKQRAGTIADRDASYPPDELALVNLMLMKCGRESDADEMWS